MEKLHAIDREKTRSRPVRHLASSSELKAAFLRFYSDGGAITLNARHWSGVSVISLALTGSGAVLIPRAAFHSVIVYSGPPPSLVDHQQTTSRSLNVAGRTTIRGPGQEFDYCWARGHRATWVCLDADLVEHVAGQCGVEPHRLRTVGGRCDFNDPVCEYLGSVLEQEIRSEPHAGQGVTVESVAKALASRVVARLATHPLSGACPPGALGIHPFQRVLGYVERNLGARISLADLAEVAGMSRFHFARQFRLRCGESPLGFVLRMRIERAKNLLCETDEKICDIAADLGFSDQSHFTRTFKRMVGLPPSHYAQSRDRLAISHGPRRQTNGHRAQLNRYCRSSQYWRGLP